MAAVHANAIPMQCEMCLHDPELKKEWGCDEPKQIAVWVDNEENEYFNCPLKFIPENVLQWYEEYSYQKEFGGALSYRKQSRKFIDAIRIYNSAFCSYKQNESKQNAKNDLSVFMRKKENV